ncbi:helix-turn-helix transcriptional regulator [Goodfellowiella coeruleoviolacea]|uniref:HTH luxR-type domain-containing protein n=1 Tax=Goodfellowiella coeruleoviolacea TaxID=334858 RepID=A0AAE3KGC3_9PSEU|nr:DNA-binding response regulator [Goodfellowiella coeruleoviolacea]MCP2166010.1 hypothetical protein [Goodfellowiella coeruleoviolacea]
MDTTDQVVVVHGERELHERTAHLLATATEEICCAANTLYTWRRGHAVPDTTRAGQRPAGAPRVRKLFRAGMLLDPSEAQHVHQVSKQGVAVRIGVDELNETIIIDRRVAILAGDTARGARGYSVVFLPEVVQAVRTLFDAAWRAATDLDVVDRSLAELRPLAPRILELLASGCKDETAARRLGLSLRTYRRRVAELMATLGADSRFQAGVRAHELGLI